MKITLFGGWGYPNLGDEAILAGYLEALSTTHQVTVISPNPGQTRSAQSGEIRVLPEYSGSPTGDAAIICGGGYLNGHWREEIRGKLRRLDARSAAHRTRIVHAVEVRHLEQAGSTRRLARKLFGRAAATSVRDTASLDEVARLGQRASIVPDAIALLYPFLGKYIEPIPALAGKVIVNFQRIRHRSDPNDAHVSGEAWDDYASGVLEALGDRAVGLIGGGGDRMDMSRFTRLPLVEPKNVRQLVSCLAAVDAVFSLRMHPALLASMLGKPVASVPYNGKIRPTLSELGLSDMIDPCTDVEATLHRLTVAPDHADAWASSHARTRAWLDCAIDRVAT